MIPLKIYRTWRTNSLGVFEGAWNFTRTHNPEFKQVLYTDDHVHFFYAQILQESFDMEL